MTKIKLLHTELYEILLGKSNVAHQNKKEYSETKQKLVKKLHAMLKDHTNLKDFKFFNRTRCELLDAISKTHKKEAKVKACEKLWLDIKETRAKPWEKRLKALENKVKSERMEEIESKRLTLDFDVPTTKKQREYANQIAHDLAMLNKDEYSSEELLSMAKFTGFGGLGGKDADEYYTPRELASASWNLLNYAEGDNILDPSCGTGIFSMIAPKGMTIQGVELNDTSGTIANALNPNTEVQQSSFEEFAAENDEPIYDGIITNVPFGKRYEAYKGKDKYKELSRSEDYFMLRSLDLLKSGKRAVFLTTSASAQRPHKKDIRLELLKKASFVGGYRLPSIMFKESGTDQVVDVLVFEKHAEEYLTQIETKNYEDGNLEDAIDISESDSDFLNGKYFNNRKASTLGSFISKEQQLANAEATGASTHHQNIKDKVETDLTLDEVKGMLGKRLNGSSFKNNFGYSELIPLMVNTLTDKELELQRTLKQRVLDEVQAIGDGEPSLKDEDFLSLFGEAEEAGIFSNLKSSIVPMVLKKIAMDNPVNMNHQTLLKLFLMSNTEEMDRHVSNNKSTFDVYDKVEILDKLKKSFRRYGINPNKALLALSMGKDEVLKSLYSENPLSVKNVSDLSTMGTPIYSLDSLTEKELESPNIGFYTDKEGVTSALHIEDAIKFFKGTNYNEAVAHIQEMESPSDISPELFAKKQKYLMEKLADYRKVGNIETLTYSLDTVNRYFKSNLKGRIMSRVGSIAGDDIVRVFKEKVEGNISKNIELLDNMKIDKKEILERVSGSLYDAFVDNKLYNEPLRLMDYMVYWDAKEFKNEINVIKGIYSSSFNDVDMLLTYYIKEAIEGDRELYSHLKDELLKHSIIDIKDDIDLSTNSEPLEELRGAVTDELIEMARIYQNEDARDFARELKGTIAQDTGLGKALRNSEIVLTPNGFKKNGDIKVGDFVIGSNGKPIEVLGVYPQGVKNIYRVSFYDGTHVDCSLDHLWTVRTRNTNPKSNKVFKTMSLEDMLKKPISKDVFDKRYGTTTKEYRYSIPYTPECHFDNNAKLNIHPYVMGLLLGDGGLSTENHIDFTNKHKSIIDKMITLLPKGVKASEIRFKNGAYRFNLVGVKRGDNPLVRELRRLNLSGKKSIDKFIPTDYLYSNIENRKALYQGLIDTDGHVLKSGNVEYGSSSKLLIEDYRTLSLSLGKKLGAIITKENPTYTYKGEKLFSKNNAYRITERTKRSETKTIINVKKLGNENCTCISVDSKDHLYVAGKGFNLTHNTITMLLTSILALKTGRSKRVLVITPNSVVSKLNAEFEKFMTDEWKDKLSVLTANDFEGELKKIRSNKNIRIVIASHSIIPMFKLKSETLDKLTHYPSETGQKEIPTPFYELIKTYPYFSNAKAFFENLQFDTIMIDEQQNFKNGVASIGLRKASHVPSDSHITLQYLCEYIRQSRGDYRGTISVTATPFTNSPSEVISNLTLSGGHIDNRGVHLPDFKTFDEFREAFIKEEDITSPKVNGLGVTTSATFSGFKDFKRLKDVVVGSVKFRDSESEQSRVKGLKVKPDYEMVVAKQKPSASIAQTFKNLSALNEAFKVSKSERERLSTKSPEEMRDSIKMTLQKTIGETFGFINKVRNLSNGTNFANGITSLIIKEGTTLNDIEKALKGANHFTFGMYKDKSKMSFEALQELEVRKEAREYVYVGLTEEEKAREQLVTDAVRDLAPDFIVKEGSNTLFNAYTIDDADINSITNKLIQAGICREGNLYEIEHYPKYKILISNMRDEYERKSVSKQIVFSDTPVLTQRIIGQIIGKSIRNGELPPLTVHYFNKQLGGLKADKSNAIKLQDNFNSSSEPDVMIYGISGITGVDFNKNVSAVHLMNIPNTPDIHHQAMGRAVRQGNDIDEVKVYKYFTSGTFDTFLDKLVSGKSDWINSLKGSEDVEDEIKLDTSSASQVMSNAMNMFGGQGLSHEEVIEKYMEYQKNEIIKEHSEINSIKIKTNIEKIDQLLNKKLLLEDSPVENVARVIGSNISKYSNYSFKFRFARFPADLTRDRELRMKIISEASDIGEIYDVIASYFEASKEKLIKETQSHLADMMKEDAENDKELSENRIELREVKRKLKLKKTSEVEKRILYAKKTQLETFIDNFKNSNSNTGAYSSEIMQKDNGQVYYNDTTEDELMTSIDNVLTREYEGLLIDIRNYLDELISIDDRIQTQVIRVLLKKGDDDYNGEATVTFKHRLLTIDEAMEVIEELR